MITPPARRQHPLWSYIGYGYGIQIDNTQGQMELGHASYFEGFNCINFHYPEIAYTSQHFTRL